MKRGWPFIFKNLKTPNPRMLRTSLVEIGPVILKKKILKFGSSIFAITQLSPLGKERGLPFEQT